MGRVGRTETALVAAPLAVVLIGASALPLAAQERPLYSAPRILQAPSGEDMAHFYPERAQRWELRGRAGIACGVDNAGLLVNCKVTHEWPVGFGFGEAALKLSRAFRVAGTDAFHTMISFELACDRTVYVAPHGRAEESKLVRVLRCPSSHDEEAVYRGGDQPHLVTLHCRLTEEGSLDNCAAEGIDPAANEAAKRLAPLWRLERPGPGLVRGVVTITLGLTPPDPGEANAH